MAGATQIEFDVQLTRDRVPILLHDADFERTGRDSAVVMDIDFADTQAIEVSETDKFGAAFAGIRAPSLEAVLHDVGGWPEVTAFVELKRHSIERFGVDAVLDAVLPLIEPVRAQCVLISFHAEVLRAARERAQLPIGWALRSYDEKSRQAAEELAPEYLFCNQVRLPPAPEPLWQGPWDWVVYEIVDPDVASELVARGIAVIETKDYARMARALRD